MISILASGVLIARPAECTSRNGNKYVRCQLRANAGDESFLVSLVAFDDHICKALLALDKGDSACVTGSGKPSTWTGRDGGPCLGLNVKVEPVDDSILVDEEASSKQRRRTAITDCRQLIPCWPKASWTMTAQGHSKTEN